MITASRFLGNGTLCLVFLILAAGCGGSSGEGADIGGDMPVGADVDASTGPDVAVPADVPVNPDVPADPEVAGEAVTDLSVDGDGVEPPDVVPDVVTDVPPAPPAVPGQPGLDGHDNQVAVEWDLTVGAEVYEVWYGTANDIAAATRFGDDFVQTSCVIAPLVEFTTVFVWIRARNDIGASDFSLPASVRVLPTSPRVPTQVTITPGDGTLTVEWEAVAVDTAYSVGYSLTDDWDSQTTACDSIAQTSCVVSGLQNGAVYFVWVVGLRPDSSEAIGESHRASPQAQPTPPAAPEGVVIGVGLNMAVVQWDDVINASAYEVWYGTSANVASAIQFGADYRQLECRVTGLIVGQTYWFWVRARNAFGVGEFSVPGSVAFTLEKAWQPFSPFVYSRDGALEVVWTTVPYAASYKVLYAAVDDVAAAVVYSEVTTTTETITGLTNGTAYWVWLKGVNALGDSAASTPSSTGTPSVGVLTADWFHADVGSGMPSGAASFDGGIFTVSGGGSTRDGVDQMHFVYRSVSGDFTLSARVDSLVALPYQSSEVGLIVRDSLAPDSPGDRINYLPGANSLCRGGVCTYYGPINAGGRLTYRGEWILETAYTAPMIPAYLRIVRRGNDFANEYSADGTVWTPVSTPTTVVMQGPVVVGMFVDSSTQYSLTTATFDNVVLTVP
jgi:hypothetical protein